MEASIALAATLLPAIERVERVTIQPSTQSPLGRTVLEVRGVLHCMKLLHARVAGVWLSRLAL
jgi:hypothetical protein